MRDLRDDKIRTGHSTIPTAKRRAFFAILAVFLTLSACSPRTRVSIVSNTPDIGRAAVDHGFSRVTDKSAFEDLAFDGWSLNYEALAPREHTLLIYMNGSDLESDNAAGTGDLTELRRSGVDESSVNVVIFTGGANRWHTEKVPSNECAVSILRNGDISQIGTLGQLDMGNAGTLSSFISFGLRYFPSEKTSLILWDHGGGSIAGYGADENFNMSTLTLLELEYAFERAGLANNKLELLGFDACLMATVEMAVVASDYAKYLLASENVEPGDGWDYRTVSVLSGGATGEEFGVAICNSYMEFYRRPQEELTLSLVLTSQAENVMGALGLLADAAMQKTENSGGFTALKTGRKHTKTFGGGTPLDSPCDMIDILDFTREIGKLCPREAELVRSALKNAVLYNIYCSDTELGGLSVYHIYSEKSDIARELEVYKNLSMSPVYTEYLMSFAKTLGHEYMLYQPLYTQLLGGRTAMYKVSATEDGAVYAVSANVNGELAELLIFRPSGATEYQAAAGKLDTLLGYRKRDGYLIQKGYEKFLSEDKVVLLFPDGGEYRELDTLKLLPYSPIY